MFHVEITFLRCDIFICTFGQQLSFAVQKNVEDEREADQRERDIWIEE
jgi:hypothetical protein